MLEPILDPRGIQKRESLKLAPRCSMDDLKKGPLLFYDNTKLSYAGYWEVYVRIVENLKKLGIKNIVYHVETVRGKYTKDLKEMGRKLVEKYRPKAAITALGDMGTSPATAIVTMGMEEAGVPAVYITAPPGHDVVRGYVHYRAGKLCLCPLDIYQASTKQEIDAEVDKQMNFIIECLTGDPKTVEKHAEVNFKYDVEAPSGDGLITLSDKIKAKEGAGSDPGAYVEEVTELLLKMGIGDGLPIIPPTKKRYERMLEYCPWDPEMVILDDIGPAGVDLTVKDIVIAAVMAGCKPTAVPVLVTAFQALTDPKYNFLQSVHTSFPGGNLVLVSGPIVKQVGLYGGQGCMGPGPWENGPIGRAVNLVLINRFRCIPGANDLDCLASPAEFTYCFAEEPGLSPWPTINEELYDKDTSTVLVLKAENPHDIIEFMCQDAYDLLVSIVDSCTTLGSNNAYMPSSLILALTPDHAQMLAREGWTKQKLKEYIHRWAVNPLPMVRNRGLSPARPKEFEGKHPVPVTRSPEDVWIVTVGGRGGHSAVIIPWALHSEAIVRPLVLPNGERAMSIEEFKRERWVK